MKEKKQESDTIQPELSPTQIVLRASTEKWLFENTTVYRQYAKLMEEVGELARALLKEDFENIEEELGDAMVVLTNIAYFKKIDPYVAFKKRAKVYLARKGKMINGTFIKEE